MIKKISRDICLIKYRKLPLCEYEKEYDNDICYYPEIYSFYWLKLDNEFENELSKEISLLTNRLNIDKLIFFGEINKPWISKFTESRKDHKPLIKAIEYFKSHGIEKKFNGGVKVGDKELKKFIANFYVITRCDSDFFDFNFIDENENYIFHIHYSGELKVLALNKNANEFFLNKVIETKLIDSETESTNRIKNN